MRIPKTFRIRVCDVVNPFCMGNNSYLGKTMTALKNHTCDICNAPIGPGGAVTKTRKACEKHNLLIGRFSLKESYGKAGDRYKREGAGGRAIKVGGMSMGRNFRG